MPSIRFINLLLLSNPLAATLGYGFIRPTPASVGLVGIQQMAPRPTRPPSMDEINGELRKRRLPENSHCNIPYSWCAFLEGDFDYPISCPSKSSQTCIITTSYIYTSIACSPYGIDRDVTTTIYETCLDRAQWLSMSTLRSSDTTVCPLSAFPYCQTATMRGGEYTIYCDSTSRRTTVSLEYLDAWFSTGSIPTSFTNTLCSASTTPITNSPTRDNTAPDPASPSGRLATPAIAGIGVAVGAVVAGAIAAIVICLFMRKRKRKEGANQPEGLSTRPGNPPMQQGNPGQGWQNGAPVSSTYSSSHTAFLKSPEQPSPPYSSEPASLYKPQSSSIGHRGGGTSLGNPIENQLYEMSTAFPLHNNPRGSGISHSPPYNDVSSHVASPARGNSENQSPPPLHLIHEAPQAYYNENQAHGIVPSSKSRQGGPGAYYDGTYPPQEFPAGGGGGGSHSHSNSVSSIPPPHDMSPPTPATPNVVTPTPLNNSETYEGQQQAQYDTHEAPTTSYTAYSPGASPATRGPLEVHHNHNVQ